MYERTYYAEETRKDKKVRNFWMSGSDGFYVLGFARGNVAEEAPKMGN